jgi:hypothetical protein
MKHRSGSGRLHVAFVISGHALRLKKQDDFYAEITILD